MAEQRDVHLFSDPDEFRALIEDLPERHPGVWLRFAKKGRALVTITYDQALDVAIAHGWIDSQVRRFDDDSYLQAFTPRRARSPWSRRNREIAEAMIADGRMRPGGARAVERAKADGRWDRAYAGPATADVPADFLAALAKNPTAQSFFDRLNNHNRYAIYYRLQEAKRPETRTRRIATFVEMLARGEKFH
ncbi:MAG: YdeI/OmpD-associated family protein [Mycobacteriales bacterium]